MEFRSFFNNLIQNRISVLNFIVTIILAMIEEIMEWEFTCASQPYNQIYFAAFLVAPSGIFFFLTFIIHGFILNTLDVKEVKCLCVLWQCSFPPWMWVAIVFLDGRYFQCAFSTNHNATKKPTNDEMSTVSQIIGLLLLLIITMLIALSYCVKKSQTSNPEPKKSENPETPPSPPATQVDKVGEQGHQVASSSSSAQEHQVSGPVGAAETRGGRMELQTINNGTASNEDETVPDSSDLEY